MIIIEKDTVAFGEVMSTESNSFVQSTDSYEGIYFSVDQKGELVLADLDTFDDESIFPDDLKGIFELGKKENYQSALDAFRVILDRFSAEFYKPEVENGNINGKRNPTVVMIHWGGDDADDINENFQIALKNFEESFPYLIIPFSSKDDKVSMKVFDKKNFYKFLRSDEISYEEKLKRFKEFRFDYYFDEHFNLRTKYYKDAFEILEKIAINSRFVNSVFITNSVMDSLRTTSDKLRKLGGEKVAGHIDSINSGMSYSSFKNRFNTMINDMNIAIYNYIG